MTDAFVLCHSRPYTPAVGSPCTMPGRTFTPPRRVTASSTASLERPYMERQPVYALTEDTKMSFFTLARAAASNQAMEPSTFTRSISSHDETWRSHAQ